MTLTIPADMQQTIKQELDSLPAIHGKVTLTLTFNCTTNRVVGTMEIHRGVIYQVRATTQHSSLIHTIGTATRLFREMGRRFGV